MNRYLTRPDIHDPSKYDRATYSRFQLLTVFYTNIFYDNIYQTARKLKQENKHKSITDAYHNTIQMFNNNIKTEPKFGTNILQRMHDSFSVSQVGTMTDFHLFLYEFLTDFYPKSFIPEDIERTMCITAAIKVVSALCDQFVNRINSELIIIIIDERSSGESRSKIMKEFMYIILEHREFLAKDIYNKNSKKPTANAMMELRQTLSKEIILLQDKVEKVTEENKQLKEATRLRLRKLDNIIMKSRSEYKKISDELVACRREIVENNRYISELEQKCNDAVNDVHRLPATVMEAASVQNEPLQNEPHFEESSHDDEDLINYEYQPPQLAREQTSLPDYIDDLDDDFLIN